MSRARVTKHEFAQSDECEGVRYWTDMAQAEARDGHLGVRGGVGGRCVMGAKPYTMDDVQAWVEMLWERERLDEMTMARIRATVEECDALKAQVEAARKACEKRLRGSYPTLSAATARQILEAMDEAAK